jgi:hypothetical protein
MPSMALVKSSDDKTLVVTSFEQCSEYREELSRATLKVYERYAVEVVERFGLCPWARASRESGEVVLRVDFSSNADDFDESIRLLAELHAVPERGDGSAEGVDIALFIYPLLDLDRLGFEDRVRRFRNVAFGGTPPLDAFAMAAFHPAAEADLSHPDRLVPFVRRSPDPTLQLVKKSALSSIKGLSSGTAFVDVESLSLASLKALASPPSKPVRERIAEQNLSTIQAVGVAEIDAILRDIGQERERAHEQLLARYGERGPRRADSG